MSNNGVQKFGWMLKMETNPSRVYDTEFGVAVAYLLYKIKLSGDYKGNAKSFHKLMNKYIPEELRPFVVETIGEDLKLDKLAEFLENSTLEDIKQFILSDEFYEPRLEYLTPNSITKLALQILQIKEGDSVIDACSGLGSFLLQAYNYQPNASYFGIELNCWISSIAKIRAELQGMDCNFTTGNILSKGDENCFEKGFMNAPLGVPLSRNGIDPDLKKDVELHFPELLRGTSTDWLFNYSLLERLSDNGRAVSVVTLGSLWNTLDTPARITFAKMGYIESIILLPAKLFALTNVAVALVVFNKSRCCGNIKFVDASQEFEKGRRQNFLSEKNISNILYALEKDTEISRYVQHEEIVKENFSFSPSLYIKQKNTIKNGVPFKDIILNITRGASCTADDLDKMSSNSPTDYQYLLLSSIKNGIIDYDLPYLKEIPPKMEKYCIKTGDLILSKNGYPFKVAVAEVPEGRKILASGNLFVIQLDTEKVNPYYIKAYLSSNEGIAALKSIVVGATIPNIGVAQLNTLPIPLIEKEKQDEIAAQYLAKVDEINLLKRKIEKAENALKDFFSFSD